MVVERIAEKWRHQLFRNDAVDRPRAEEALRALYRAAGLPEPDRFLWCSSPLEAIWRLAVLLGDDEPYTRPLLQDVRRSSAGKARLKSAAEAAAAELGIGQDQVAGFLGQPLSASQSMQGLPMRLAAERIDLLVARAGAGRGWQVGDSGPFAPVDAGEELLFGHRQPGLYTKAAEQSDSKNLAVLLTRSAQHRLYSDRAFGEIARDEAIAEESGVAVSPLARAFWAACEATGLWWPLQRGVVLAERPRLAEGTGTGLRLEWADGFTVGGAGAPPKPAKAAKPARAAGSSAASILSAELPRDHGLRIARLRDEAPGLPHFDRYLAGEHEQVWKDLAALKAKVRLPQHAADALAVAYETMHRVEQNVVILAERLSELGFSFVEPGRGGGLLGTLFGSKPKEHPPHVPPSRDSWSRIRELEQTIGGPIPLSLRAFYDLVGEVNLSGEHEAIAPRGGRVLPDPLFVYGVEDAMGWLDSIDFDEEGKSVAIAPDEYHKANISGGDPYTLRVPAAGADARLRDAPYKIDFVDYLRLAFHWGGFPGWARAKASAPAEIARLREGLLSF